MWQRFSTLVIKETKVTEWFTDHDIRAKVDNDMETDEETRQMFSHATTAVTRKHYRRKPKQVIAGRR